MEFRLVACLVVVLLVQFTSSARTPLHSVTAYCIKNDVASTMEMQFALDLNNDPTGNVVGRDNLGLVACSADSTDTGYWRRTSTINLGTSSGTFPCGVVRTIVNSINVYTWKFYYTEQPNGEATVDGGLNRIYTITCDENTATNSRVSASLSVTTPNINKDVDENKWKPDVSMQVLYQLANGQFTEPLATTQIPVGTALKLQLKLDYGTFSAIKPYGIAGLQTETAANPQFTSQNTQFFNSNGCQSSTVFAPSQGYAMTDNGATTGVFVAQTGSFAAWLFETAPIIYFRTTFVTCTSAQLGSVTVCDNACNANTVTGRRRRSTGNDEFEIVTSIRIYDDSKRDKEGSAGSLLPVIIGVSIAGVVVIILLVAGLVYMATRRRRHADEPEKKVPAEGLENKMYSAY